jgi:hypothetical protein
MREAWGWCVSAYTRAGRCDPDHSISLQKYQEKVGKSPSPPPQIQIQRRTTLKTETAPGERYSPTWETGLRQVTESSGSHPATGDPAAPACAWVVSGRRKKAQPSHAVHICRRASGLGPALPRPRARLFASGRTERPGPLSRIPQTPQVLEGVGQGVEIAADLRVPGNHDVAGHPLHRAPHVGSDEVVDGALLAPHARALDFVVDVLGQWGAFLREFCMACRGNVTHGFEGARVSGESELSTSSGGNLIEDLLSSGPLVLSPPIRYSSCS